MDRTAIAGLSLNEADVDRLEALARPERGREASFLGELADELGASELVVLATCNRVEIVYARESGHLPNREDLDPLLARLAPRATQETVAELRERMHHVSGLDAIRHLFRVSCSLDSLVVGEDQILGQVREAYHAAREAGLVGELLRPTFEQAFRIAKRVRTETELSRIPVSVVSLGVEALKREMDGLTPRVALIGSGRMAALVARTLAREGQAPAVVAGRTIERARALASQHGAHAVGLDAFRAGDEPVDALFSATAAPGTVLAADDVLRLAGRTPLGRPLVAIDLAVPRDVEQVEDPRVRSVDLEVLRASAEVNRQRRERAALEAEHLIEEKLSTMTRRQSERGVEGLLAELRQTNDELFEHSLRQLSLGDMAGLSPLQRDAIERWARSTFGRLAHQPMAVIRRLAGDNGEAT